MNTLVAAVIAVVITMVIWYYFFAGNFRGFFYGYGLREKRNLNLKDFLSKTKPEISLFICEGCELHLNDAGDFIQWIKKAVQRSTRVKILLGPESDKTYGLEHLKNITLYRLAEEPERGFILVKDEGFVTAFIQERLKGQKTENIYAPVLFPGSEAMFFKEFNELRKRASFVKF